MYRIILTVLQCTLKMIIKKVEQTKKITEDLTDIVRKNEENAFGY